MCTPGDFPPWSVPVIGPGGHVNKPGQSGVFSEVLKLGQRIWLLLSGKEIETGSLLVDGSSSCFLRSRKSWLLMSENNEVYAQRETEMKEVKRAACVPQSTRS